MDETAPQKGTVTQRAIEQIKALIAEGRLEPGQRLPTERDLAVQLGISRSSMREAIRALTVLGVLERPATAPASTSPSWRPATCWVT